MAETLKGFWPINNYTGSAPRIREYPCAAATAFYEGAPVVLLETGLAAMLAASDQATAALIGICAAYKAGGTGQATVVKVYDDPGQEFLCTATTQLAQDTAQLLYFDVDSPDTEAVTGLGRSAARLVTGATSPGELANPFIIIGLYAQPDNTWTAGPNGDTTRYRAKIVESQHWLGAPLITGAA